MRTYLKKRRSRVELELNEVLCNCCGHAFECLDVGMIPFKMFLGYGTEFDLEEHDFDLCNNCYKTFINSFLYRVDVRTIQEIE